MSTKKLFCVQCDELREIMEKQTQVTHNIKGEEINVEAIIPHCSICGNEISDLDVEEKHFNHALNEYRKRKNLLSPKEIKEIRDIYGLSQRAFARALGFAESSMNRYELGALQDVIHNNLLLLVKDPKNMLRIAYQNRENLTTNELKLIEQKVNIKENYPNDEKYIPNIEKALIEYFASKIDSLEKKVDFLTKEYRNINTRSYLRDAEAIGSQPTSNINSWLSSTYGLEEDKYLDFEKRYPGENRTRDKGFARASNGSTYMKPYIVK